MRTMIYASACFLIRILPKKYRQGHGQVKYIIQSDISPYIEELVQSDLQGQPFTFHYDETINSQVK